MTDRVPEFALVTALVLGVAGGAFVAWVGRVTDAILVAAVLTYPFAAYAVVHDDDPTTVLPPRAVAAAGVFAGLAAPVGALGTGRSVFEGLLVGTVVALPALAYATRYGDGGPPARPTVAVGVAVAVGVSVVGLAVGDTAGVILGPLVGLAAAAYGWSRGFRHTRRRRGTAVVGGVLGATGSVAVAALGRVGTTVALIGAAGFVLAPALFYAATVETTAFE